MTWMDESLNFMNRLAKRLQCKLGNSFKVGKNLRKFRGKSKRELGRDEKFAVVGQFSSNPQGRSLACFVPGFSANDVND